MHRTRNHALTVGSALSLLLANACSHDRNSASGPPAPNDDIGVSVTELPLLAAGCAITTGVMTVTVKDGESAYLSLRTSDSMVTVNGNIFAASGSAGSGAAGAAADTGRPCEIASTGTINILADTGGTKLLGRSVILDYVNGLYMKAASATTPNVKIDFTLANDTGTKNSLKIRGSDAADSFAIGAGVVATGQALNINALATTPAPTAGSGGSAGAGGAGAGSNALDAFPDVTFKNITTVIVSSGAGDDRLDASGTAAAGVGTAYPTAVSLYGNDGNDTIIGGLGDDTLVGGLGADILNGCQGNDTYDMGSVASGADIIAEACAGTAEGTDTLDYSKRTGNLTVTLSRTLSASTTPATDSGGTSGETGELAHISDKIVNIKLGAGDDTLTIPAMSAVNHKIKGGRGDDTFNGNGGQDTFDGEAGDDTCISANSIMAYSSRTAGVNVSLCATSCTSADANDGDQSATGSSHYGTGAATTASGGIGISVLAAGSGFAPASVGNTLTLSNCTAGSGADNGAYTIVEYVGVGSVKLDVTAVSGFVADTSCDFSELRPDATTNTGTAATLAAKQTTGSVTGLNHTTNVLGHSITLTHTASSTGGGASNSNDDGTFLVLKVLAGGTSVAIDNFTVGSTFAGAVTALDWVESGAEHDNIQCAHILGGSGDDTIVGDARSNILRGGNGNDTLNGGAGNDTLYGEAGNDNLYGGAGDDTLVGADGTDVMVGGDGNDVLEGDAGNDAFTCDGNNSSTATSIGSAPGDSDFRVDFATGDTLGVTPTDCEF